MRFGTVVEGARWDEDAKRWQVSIAGGEPLTREVPAHRDRLPVPAEDARHPGHRPFAGKVIHTTKWDDTYDLTGKRAAVIGTGATAVQLIPELAPRGRRADGLPAHADLGAAEGRHRDPGAGAAAVRAGAAHPARGPRWSAPHPRGVMVIGVLHYRQARLLQPGAPSCSRRRICAARSGIPTLRRKLTPDYDFGCKRPTFSNTYYRDLHQAARRISRPTPSSAIEPDGIVTADGRKTESTRWCWRPASTCGRPTSRPSR